jgi:hypothetical protein
MHATKFRKTFTYILQKFTTLQRREKSTTSKCNLPEWYIFLERESKGKPIMTLMFLKLMLP